MFTSSYDLLAGPYYYLLVKYYPIIIAYIMLYKMCKAFGKEGRFIVGMLILPIVFKCLIAWGGQSILDLRGDLRRIIHIIGSSGVRLKNCKLRKAVD